MQLSPEAPVQKKRKIKKKKRAVSQAAGKGLRHSDSRKNMLTIDQDNGDDEVNGTTSNRDRQTANESNQGAEAAQLTETKSDKHNEGK